MPYTTRTPNVKFAYVASDTLLQTNNTSWTCGLTYVKVATMMVIHDVFPVSTLRFHVWCGASAGSTYYTIYKNGIPISAEQGGFNGADADRGALDVSFTDLMVTDTLEIWARNSIGVNGHGSKFTVSGTESPLFNN
jgi:hypothetical protein